MRYSIDEQFMHRCIQLAKLGQYHASPNPMVGAVLVHNGAIIGEGWHKKAGTPHAEVNCIRSVRPEHQHLISESTIYVSLEPCAHYGKTPPCASLLIEHKIPKVVIGCVDTFSKVSGKGIEMLKEAGIEVSIGILEEECKNLNAHFFTFHEKKRPFVALKWAESCNGFIAPTNGQKVMLSNAYSLTKVHQWRANFDAFLIGYNTALIDNPFLNNRKWPVDKQPVRIVLDPDAQLPEDLHIFDNKVKSIIITKSKEETQGLTQWIAIGETFIPENILSAIYKIGIQSIMIEGGSKTLQSFIDAALWDEAYIFKTENSINEGVKAPQIDYSHHRNTQILDNTLIHIKR